MRSSPLMASTAIALGDGCYGNNKARLSSRAEPRPPIPSLRSLGLSKMPIKWRFTRKTLSFTPQLTFSPISFLSHSVVSQRGCLQCGHTLSLLNFVAFKTVRGGGIGRD